MESRKFKKERVKDAVYSQSFICIYTEKVSEKMNDRKLDAKIQKETIRTIRFADDTAMLEKCQEKLEKTWNILGWKLGSNLK